MSESVVDHVLSKGVQFALLEDACKAVLRISTDKSINGEITTNIRLIGFQLPGVLNFYLGRALAIVPREESPAGYVDVAHDDYAEGDFLRELQSTVLATSHRVTVSHSLSYIKYYI
jgi:hypothetical protein